MYGVLVIHGHDRRGVLQHALNFLHNLPAGLQVMHEPCNIHELWLRGVGDFGGVLIGFTTDENTLFRLKDRSKGSSLAALNDRLNEGLSGELKKEHRMRADVYSVERKSEGAPFVTRLDFARAGRCCTMESFRQLLAILASEDQVDVAFYDRVEVKVGMWTDQIAECWELRDLAGRGLPWLKRCIEQANEVAYETEGHAVEPICELEALEVHQVAAATLQTQGAVRHGADEGHLCFRVHCQDTTRLLERIVRFAHLAPGKDGAKANRSIIRVCCAGIDGHALALVATHGAVEDAADLAGR